MLWRKTSFSFKFCLSSSGLAAWILWSFLFLYFSLRFQSSNLTHGACSAWWVGKGWYLGGGRMMSLQTVSIEFSSKVSGLEWQLVLTGRS